MIIRNGLRIKLTNEESLWRNIHKKHKYDIKKLENIIYVSLLKSVESLKIFYKIYKENAKRNNWAFESYRYFSQKDNFIVAIGSIVDGNFSYPVSASFFLLKEDKIEYEATGTKKEYLKYSPNKLIIWNLMIYGLQKGYDYLDLRYVDKKKYPTIYRFKERFGGKPYIKLDKKKKYTLFQYIRRGIYLVKRELTNKKNENT